jgi:hypothetical protein
MNATKWTKNQNQEITVEMIESGLRKFNVIEDGAKEATTVEIENINDDGSVDYSVVENGRVLCYGELTVTAFVENYLSQCSYTAPHWTRNA